MDSQRFLKRNHEEIEKIIDSDCEYEFFSDNVKGLVVDDNDINLRIGKIQLEKKKIKADLACSGEECIKMCDSNKYDVILMDHMMPGMDGIETLVNLRKSSIYNSDTPVLLVTANDITKIHQEFLESGFDGYVSKPINQKELAKELLKVLPPDKFNIVLDGDSDLETATQNTEDKDMRSVLSAVGIDVDEGLKYCGDIEYYEEILKIALDSYKNRHDNILKAYQEKDYKNYTILVHSLKSGAANIGATKLSELAKDLEYAGKEGNISLIQDKTEELLQMYTNTISSIDKLFAEEFSEASDAPVDALPINENTWNDKLSNMEFLMDELESDEAICIAKELSSYDISDQAKKILDEMIELLDISDIENAKEKLESLRNIRL